MNYFYWNLQAVIGFGMTRCSRVNNDGSLLERHTTTLHQWLPYLYNDWFLNVHTICGQYVDGVESSVMLQRDIDVLMKWTE